MKILCVDLETSGLPPKGANYETDFALFPYPVQIAWVITTDAKRLLIKNNHIIRPDNWTIPVEASNIHGIDHDAAMQCGEDMLSVLRHLIWDCNHADKIIGHNLYFDLSIVKASLIRLGIKPENYEKQLDKEKRVDTMKQSINYMKLAFKNGNGYKWPKLEELYFRLFNKPIDGAHNAMVDVNATLECYFELVRLKIIN
jgi:DNA polymerase III epsilon subunit-like protein